MIEVEGKVHNNMKDINNKTLDVVVTLKALEIPFSSNTEENNSWMLQNFSNKSLAKCSARHDNRQHSNSKDSKVIYGIRYLDKVGQQCNKMEVKDIKVDLEGAKL